MNLLQRSVIFIIIFCFLTIFSLFQWSAKQHRKESHIVEIKALVEEIQTLKNHVQKSQVELAEVNNQIHKTINNVNFKNNKKISNQIRQKNLEKNEIWSEPIAVLVFVCNRAEAVKKHLEKLIQYRKSNKIFQIFVSQDCDNKNVTDTVQQFIPNIQYIKHPNIDIIQLNLSKSQQRYAIYYKIARHYKLALELIFEKFNYTSVIITEDDLNISPDFFDYFLSTRMLLEKDKTLYCVSAWNDNGKSNLIDLERGIDLLYRTDFFPGLGWMMTSDLWKEIGKKWPIGFWDDWIREPEQRQNRSCIRPEISRTSMTLYGKKGASKGLFFNKHLKLIHLNTFPVNFTQLNLNYLIKPSYDSWFLKMVYSLTKLNSNDFLSKLLLESPFEFNKKQEKTFRLEYASMEQFTELAKKLQIMVDTKAGVPRTAYQGIVSCYLNGFRLYIAPVDGPKTWSGYDRNWIPPPEII